MRQRLLLRLEVPSSVQPINCRTSLSPFISMMLCSRVVNYLLPGPEITYIRTICTKYMYISLFAACQYVYTPDATGEAGPHLHDAIGVIDHVVCREQHATAPHEACVLAEREGNQQGQVVYQGCIAQQPSSRVGDVKGVTCIVYVP